MHTQTQDIGAGFRGLSANTAFHYSRVAAPPVEREYYNATALAQYLGVSLMTLHRWRYGHTVKDKNGQPVDHAPLEGFPPAYDLGGTPLFKRSEIDQFIASRKVCDNVSTSVSLEARQG